MNSKQKGSRAERQVAKLFTNWTGYEFTRTPSSGGLRWQRKKDTVGDLICSDDKHSRYFTFSIEVKFHKEISFEDLLLPNKCKILEFWKQALEDSERSKKIPLLLMRYNGLPKDFYYLVIGLDYYNYISKEHPKIPFILKGASLVNTENEIVVTTFENLTNLHYLSLHKTNKKYLKEYGK